VVIRVSRNRLLTPAPIGDPAGLPRLGHTFP
jgi:hypothetical protein